MVSRDSLAVGAPLAVPRAPRPLPFLRMKLVRIALANLRYPATRAESVSLAERAIADASAAGAALVAFPECFVPGYRAPGGPVAPPAPAFLDAARATLAAACAKGKIVAVVGTERFVEGALRLTALVLG